MMKATNGANEMIRVSWLEIGVGEVAGGREGNWVDEKAGYGEELGT